MYFQINWIRFIRNEVVYSDTLAKYRCKICGRKFTKAEGKGSIKTHCAGHKAQAHPNRKKKSSGKKGKTKTVRSKLLLNKEFYFKNDRIKRKCKGIENMRNEDGVLIPCNQEHDISSFYASGEILVSEGIMEKWLQKKFGKNSLVFNTGSAKKLFDIGVYHSHKPKRSLEFYEIKPRKSKRLGEQLLKKQQTDWGKEAMKMGITTKLVFYKEDNFEFRHSEPIPLHMDNIKNYSKPYNEKKEKNLEKIKCRKLFNDKKLEEISENCTGHSVKFMREIKNVLDKTRK